MTVIKNGWSNDRTSYMNVLENRAFENGNPTLYKPSSLVNTYSNTSYVIDNKAKITIMKKNRHPEVKAVSVRCTCGNSFQTESTRSQISATLCSNCHPFYTGDQKFVDTAGRIEKFNRKYKRAS